MTADPLADLERWDRPGPRYTSYPTVPVWGPVTPDVIAGALRGVRSPAQLYVHVPFCAQQCLYCGCNMVVAGRQDAGDKYLDRLEAQVAALPLPSDVVEVERIHIGGGTPTWLSVAQLRRLYQILGGRFHPTATAEYSVEADPDITTLEQLDALHELGVRRLSIGVQTFDPVVQEAVHRPQRSDHIRALVAHARELGWWGLNLDIMYGLPKQDMGSFTDTVRAAIELGPDRIAAFGYAHVPWMKRHMNRISQADLAQARDRARMFLLAQRAFSEAGYEAIGLDHFARPDDELAVAHRDGTLHRNFMGYTTKADVDMIGLGMSAISDVGGVYWQDEPKLARWGRKVDAGLPLAVKGWTSTGEDRVRRAVITEILCNLQVDIPAFEAEHGVVFAEHFADALQQLGELEQAGFVVRDAERLQVTESGRLLVRLVAMPFDAYLGGDRGRFSRAV